MKPERTALGLKIQRLRKDRGWSQRTLAMKANIGESRIKGIEVGKSRHPRQDGLEPIAAAFGISVTELIAGTSQLSEPIEPTLVDPPDSSGTASGHPLVTLAQLHLAMATERYDDAAELNARLADEINRLRGRAQRKAAGAQRVAAQTDQ